MDHQKTKSQGAAADCKPLTTFVQTDTNAFRDVVQRLTGPSAESSELMTDANGTVVTNDGAAGAGIKRPTPKLHERRQYTRPKLEIVKPPINLRPFTSPTASAANSSSSLFASPMGTPSTIFSKLAIWEHDNNNNINVMKGDDQSPFCESINSEEEEKAIKEKRFYLHPSPRSKPAGHNGPQLLALFPLTSPKTSQKAAS